MKRDKIIYWATTALLALLFMFSASMALQSSPEYLEGIQKMGFPDYFPRIHGILKLLAAILLLIPVKTVFKHWAYAGMTFTLIFASFAHNSVDEPFFMQLAFIPILFVSYYFYEKKMDFKALPF